MFRLDTVHQEDNTSKNDNSGGNTKTDSSKKKEIVPASNNVPNTATVEAQVAVENINTITQVYAAKQEYLYKIAVENFHDIPYTNAKDPSTLDEIVEFDQNYRVQYHELSIGQSSALAKKKALIDDMNRTIGKMATDLRDKKISKLPDDFHKMQQQVNELQEQYDIILYRLLLDFPQEKVEKSVTTKLNNVAAAWELRNRLALPNSVTGSETSSSKVYQ